MPKGKRKGGGRVERRRQRRAERRRQREANAEEARSAWSFVLKRFGTILAVVSFVGGPPVFYGLYYAAPTIAAPDVDKENPFALPFTISNDSYLLFHNVRPECSIEYFDFGWMQGGNGQTAGFERWGDLGVGEKRHYACPFVTYENYKKLVITIDTHYRPRPLAFLPFITLPELTKQTRFEALRASGTARWVEGYEMGGEVGHPHIGTPQWSPRFIEAQRRPGTSQPAVPGRLVLLGRPKTEIARDEASERRTPGPDS